LTERFLTTAEVAQILGLTAQQVLHFLHHFEIQVLKHSDRYVWTETAVENLRAALRQRETLQEKASPPGLTAKQAAQELGLSYDELLRAVQQYRIPVQRIGPQRRLVFDDAALERVREALERPEPPPRRLSGLTTKETATALGVGYEILTAVMAPLRSTLPLTKEGGRLLWSADAIRIMREALERRHAQQSIGEVEDHEQAVHAIEILAAGLQKLATDTKKLKDLLSRKPAETGFIHTLPARTHVLPTPLRVLLNQVAGIGFQASLPELSLVTEARTRQEALGLMRRNLWDRYCEVSMAPGSAPEEWTVLQQLISPRQAVG
jgi:hypothetical protein